jgi:ligand-binding sensor domain-containing protein/signal transduction histidine kinase
VQDGLPDQTVQAFAQTRDGYLWIGTKDGLLRYDGSQFVLFSHANTSQFGESSVNCLLAGSDGGLWIGTEGGGLYHYSKGAFRQIPTMDGLSNSFVRVIFKDSRGVVWVGGDQGLYRISESHLQRVDGSHGVPSIFVRAITEDSQGDLWVGGTLLMRLGPSGTVRQYRFPGGPNHNLVTSIVSRGPALWFGTLSGMGILDPGGRLRSIGNPNWSVQTMVASSDGAIWVGTLGDGVLRYAQGRFERAVAPSALPSNTVLAIFEDGEHDLWLGTQGGMERLTASPVTIFPFPGDADAQFETIYGDRDGTVWCAATHLFRIRDNHIELAAIPSLPEGLHVRTLVRDHSGTLWVGTDGHGVFRIAGQHVKQYAVRNGMANDFPRVLLPSRDGSMWVGTDGGLSHITAKGMRSYNIPQGLAYFSVTALLESNDGGLWIGTSRGLSHLRNGHFLDDGTIQALSREKIWSLYQDGKGAIWIGTSNGLYRLLRNRLERYSAAQGLPENIIYMILGDSTGHLWLSSPGSVAWVDSRTLVAQRNPGYHVPLAVKLYPIAQDFNSAVLYSGMQPAGFLDAHGNAWLPSNKGAVRIRAPQTSFGGGPRFPVVIDTVLVDGQKRTMTREVKLRPGTARVEVGFAAILLTSQQGMRYRYRLQGFDQNWNDASASRTASYTNLRPGSYRLHVEAYEAGDPSTVAQTSLELVQQPYFYKTTWFGLLCATVLLLILAAAHGLRVKQVAMRFRAVLEERNRLAHEMHDTLIQDCAGVSALLEAVSKLDFADKSLCHELIDHARQQISITIDETRTAVWNLRQSALQGRMMPIHGAIEEIAMQLRERSGLSVRCMVSGEAYLLPSPVVHELTMIVREALANAAQHARATEVNVRVAFELHGLAVTIEDDGIGFDPRGQAVIQNELHYGLRVMKERADGLGGVFSLESSAGSGTVIQVRLPRRMRDSSQNGIGGHHA